MNSSKAGSKGRPSRQPQTKTEEAATAIERLLEKHGVAPLAAQAVRMGKEIGKGRFKQVNEGRLRQKCGGDCRSVVVMRYEKKDSEVRELDILALLAEHATSRPFVPEVFGVVNERSTISIVQECAQWGTLRDILSNQDICSRVTVAHSQQAAQQIAGALAFIASLSIVHADVACRNVLAFSVEEDPRKLVTKITDFGLAIILREGEDSQCLKQPIATRWCSPETVAFNKLSTRSDVWSFGVTLWELFAGGSSPWEALEKRADVAATLQDLASRSSEDCDMSGDFPVPGACPTITYNILISCLKINENLRPTAAQLHMALSRVDSSPADPIFGIVDNSGASVGASASVCSEPCDVENCEASTEASVADVGPTSAETSEAASLGAPRWQILSDCLRSQRADQILSSQPMGEMQHELQAVFKWDEVDSRCQHIDSCHMQNTENANSTTVAHNNELLERPVRELVLPLASQSGPGRAKCWESAPPLSIWTLWSPMENNALRRRDFVSEAAARAALNADGYGALMRQEVFAKSPTQDAIRGWRWTPVLA